MLEYGKLFVYIIDFLADFCLNLFFCRAFKLFIIGVTDCPDCGFAGFVLSADDNTFRNIFALTEIFFKLFGEDILSV